MENVQDTHGNPEYQSLETQYRNLINLYKERRKEHSLIQDNELYKWQLFTACAKNTDKEMIDAILSYRQNNLIDWRNKDFIHNIAVQEPQRMAEIAKNIFDESQPLKSRTNYFIGQGGDERTLSVFLACKYPDKYMPYKYDYYASLCDYLGIKRATKTSEKFPHYLKIMEPLVNLVRQDGEIHSLLAHDIDDLRNSDPLIAQDVVYAIYLHVWEKEKDIKTIRKMETQQKYSEIIALLRANHNLVLTGAPGTGKSYMAREIAKEMGAVPEMVQFHPSYDYTDFVEGLRPQKDDSGNIGFERRDGVFKAFCAKAQNFKPNTSAASNEEEEALSRFKKDLKNRSIEISSIRSDTKIRVELNENNSISIPDKSSRPISDEKMLQYLKKKDCHHNDTYTMSIGEYILKNYLPNLSEEIKSSASKPFVFIIDEINRGEVSKIFGELFYSIDPDYRGEKGCINTQYQNLIEEGDPFKNGFFVPENVYIIGTMNDIDRSVESMDFAMRRRFAWHEVTAEDSYTNIIEHNDAIPEDIKDEICNRMTALNAAISDERTGLGAAYQIGAAYFLKAVEYAQTDGTAAAFRKLWKHHLEGLLTEYLRGGRDVAALLDGLHKAYDTTNGENGNQDDGQREETAER